MVLTLSVLLGALQVVTQAFAFYFAYKIYNHNRVNKAWLAITLALAIMTWWRVASLTLEVIDVSTTQLETVERVLLPLLVSALLLLGLGDMSRRFDDFAVLDQNVARKVEAFQSARKTRKKKKSKK